MSEIDKEITEFLGQSGVPGVFSEMNDSPDHKKVMFEKYKAVLSHDGEISRRDKELIGLGVAIAKPSNYMITYQKCRATEAGADHVAIDNTVKVAEFFEGADTFAHALRIGSDVRPRPLMAGDMSGLTKEDNQVNVPLIMESDDPEVTECFEDISKTFGGMIPNFFRPMAYQPEMMKKKWDTYKATMTTSGEPSRLTRECVAIAVSAVNSCNY